MKTEALEILRASNGSFWRDAATLANEDRALSIAMDRMMNRYEDAPWLTYRTIRVDFRQELDGWTFTWHDQHGRQNTLVAGQDQDIGFQKVRHAINDQLDSRETMAEAMESELDQFDQRDYNDTAGAPTR